jgi:hypothetical protein
MSRASTIIIDESNEKNKDNTLIKRITSGTSIPYRELSTNGGTLQICATVLYFSNNNVFLNEIDSGISRRIVEFESPEKTIPIEWNKSEPFVNIFLREKNAIIADFVESFKFTPKQNYRYSSKVVKSGIEHFFKMFKFEDGAIMRVQDFNRKIEEVHGKITQAQKRLIKNELERKCVTEKTSRLPNITGTHYCYIGITLSGNVDDDLFFN